MFYFVVLNFFSQYLNSALHFRNVGGKRVNWFKWMNTLTVSSKRSPRTSHSRGTLLELQERPERPLSQPGQAPPASGNYRQARWAKDCLHRRSGSPGNTEVHHGASDIVSFRSALLSGGFFRLKHANWRQWHRWNNRGHKQMHVLFQDICRNEHTLLHTCIHKYIILCAYTSVRFMDVFKWGFTSLAPTKTNPLLL